MTKRVNQVSFIRNLAILLDVIIALIIIVGSKFIISTQFGQAALAFGFIMICIVTVLKFTEKL